MVAPTLATVERATRTRRRGANGERTRAHGHAHAHVREHDDQEVPDRWHQYVAVANCGADADVDGRACNVAPLAHRNRAAAPVAVRRTTAPGGDPNTGRIVALPLQPVDSFA